MSDTAQQNASGAPALQAECVAEAIQAALTPIFPDAVFPQLYTGQLLEYAVWNYSVVGEAWAEGAPQAARYLVQAHYYLPHGKDPRPTLLRMEQALFEKRFTWPIPTDASDAEGQHWVLECEYADGGPAYGYA